MNLSRKRNFGIVYGLMGGLAYATTTWGLDAFALARSHAAHPWLNFIPGLVLALALGAFSSWLAFRTDSTLVGSFAWMVSGIILAFYSVWMSRWLNPKLIVLLDPQTQGWIDFPWYDSNRILFLYSALVSGAAGLITGMLQNTMVEQASYKIGYGSIIGAALFSMAVMGAGGVVVDITVNQSYRNALVTMDELFTFAIDNRGKEVDSLTARQIHLGAVGAIDELLSENRKIYYFTFTETTEQGELLIKFKNGWSKCTVILEQPIFCKVIEPPQ